MLKKRRNHIRKGKFGKKAFKSTQLPCFYKKSHLTGPICSLCIIFLCTHNFNVLCNNDIEHRRGKLWREVVNRRFNVDGDGFIGVQRQPFLNSRIVLIRSMKTTHRRIRKVPETFRKGHPGLEKPGRLVAICDQKIFLATRSWAAVVNLATKFSTQGSSLATPVLRWVPCANKLYCIATGKERQVSEN